LLLADKNVSFAVFQIVFGALDEVRRAKTEQPRQQVMAKNCRYAEQVLKEW